MGQYVDIHLDKPRRLRYTINAIRELERFFGKSFGRILDKDNLGYEEIIQMVTVGLKYGETEKRALTDQQVGDLLQKKWLDNGKDLGEAVDLALEALRAGGIIAKKATTEDGSEEDEHQSVGGRKELPND